MSRGGASLTTYSRQGAALCQAYGTTDVAEAIKREIAEGPEVRGLTKNEILENTVKELRSMEAKCKKCGNLFTYDGRKVKQTPDNCGECGQEKPEDLKGFNPVERPEPAEHTTTVIDPRSDEPEIKETGSMVAMTESEVYAFVGQVRALGDQAAFGFAKGFIWGRGVAA